ncbi:MAG TPA: hypothetical protein VMR33_10255 [Candidatus Baltobacteraceae bacterium]|jgi:hypothetical protein|nr:hypothetical protein [Candidatus Baltobacteraceae bacterium]
MTTGEFSEMGFGVVADNSFELLAGTQAAGAGMISANVHRLGTNLHADLGRVQQTIINQARQASDVNRRGFDNLQSTVKSQTNSLTTAANQGVDRIDQTIDTDLGQVDDKIAGLEAISAASVAVTAAGFASTVLAISRLRGDVKAMHGELAQQGRQLLELQKLANTHLESLVDYASRTLTTQERILETLVNSRTAEAKQLIRQGWDNLKGGFDDDAFIRFEKSLEYDNTVYFPHAELARIYEKRGAAERSEEHHRRAIVFAAGVNAETKGYASIQYAAFLERQKRLEDCVKQARNALEVGLEDGKTANSASTDNQKDASKKYSSSSAGWRFYLAEMLVKSGKVESGLAELKTCIQEDARFFEAAMASACFKAAQPGLSQFLIKLDAEQRARAIDPLNKCEAPLKALDILDPAEAKTLRARAAKIFEDILPSTFANLKKHEQDGCVLLADIEALISIVVAEKASIVAKSLNAVDGFITERPKVMNRQAWLVAAGSCTGIIIAMVYAIDNQTVNQSGVGLTFWIFIIACVLAFVVTYFVRSLLQLDELLVWKNGFAEPVKVFKKLKSACLREFSSAQALYKAPRISEAISKLTAQKIDTALAKMGPMRSDEYIKALKMKWLVAAAGVGLLCCYILYLIWKYADLFKPQ